VNFKVMEAMPSFVINSRKIIECLVGHCAETLGESMKIAVIGASVGIGLKLVRQLQERGHPVTTLSRRLKTIR